MRHAANVFSSRDWNQNTEAAVDLQPFLKFCNYSRDSSKISVILQRFLSFSNDVCDAVQLLCNNGGTESSDEEAIHQTSSSFAIRATGWQRLIGSPKLQIIFHKGATRYRSLLRKITYKDKGSYESSFATL